MYHILYVCSKFSNSSNSDFLETFGSVAHSDGNVSVREVMWNYLNTDGYPVINVTSLNRTHINISQVNIWYSLTYLVIFNERPDIIMCIIFYAKDVHFCLISPKRSAQVNLANHVISERVYEMQIFYHSLLVMIVKCSPVVHQCVGVNPVCMNLFSG